MGANPGAKEELRRFFARGSLEAETLEFAEGEEAHARRVLRLGPGDRALAADGHGGERRCLLVADGRGLALVPDGPTRRFPAPGEAGSPLPHISVAVPWPRGERGEAMLDRLVQWGVARIQPLLTHFTGPGDRWRPDRLERIAREALKQSRGSHLPELLEPLPLDRVLDRDLGCLGTGTLFWLDPRAERSLARELAEPQHPLVPAPAQPWPRPVAILVGPEGGFREDEMQSLRAASAVPVGLGPRILRIETAAEGAVALVVGALAGIR